MTTGIRSGARGFLVAALILSAPVQAAELDYKVAPDVVSTLVVQAVAPGPAWWKVTKGDSTLWILGTPPYLAKNYRWDKRTLQRRLTGARNFLTPPYLLPQPIPQSRVTVASDRLGAPGLRVSDLSPEVRNRLRRASLSFRFSPEDNWSVVYTTHQVSDAMFKRASLDTKELELQLTKEARRAKVNMATVPLDTRQIASVYAYSAIGPQQACLSATLDMMAKGDNPVRASLDAWAKGNLAGALAAVGCVDLKMQLYPEEVRATVSILEGYLAAPGKNVAAIELLPLLMEGGVLERLMARGYTITGPEIDTEKEGAAIGIELGRFLPRTP